ncbi:MAG: hypothetical protein LKJ29_00370 [Lactobacillus sp.]|jgi:hypothetical protein|uniref:Uncharacterized protein n=1 Tax=Lacticaseibacillus suilingensis TaxID=2799577 RepID=A0ABW4BK88_9LACO|nr:hypothetical protein [Lacticaseibacillus suilingensis]MCI1893298.1 hypothetical protein [Lactobacillus sp.]MCI1918061.1 hypothetical protein [Lactobacillus sp.]MCI1940483.1 hypothetical protein [Lactobacillus sp.]MCI1971112.1 hypothetical protein [Lactobacillus sp.]MCI2017855.1 hypothetical protein [Lactobacillus sp.]
MNKGMGIVSGILESLSWTAVILILMITTKLFIGWSLVAIAAVWLVPIIAGWILKFKRPAA